jgi:hypothetical protein
MDALLLRRRARHSPATALHSGSRLAQVTALEPSVAVNSYFHHGSLTVVKQLFEIQPSTAGA